MVFVTSRLITGREKFLPVFIWRFIMGIVISMLVRNWKPIVTGIIILSLCGALIGFGMRYQSLKDKEKVLYGQISTLESEIKDKEELIAAKEHKIQAITESANKTQKALENYIKLNRSLQEQKNKIQCKYNEALERINNEKIPVNESGSISEPYVIVPAGMPTSVP
jgi:sensor histidine kinase YesM